MIYKLLEQRGKLYILLIILVILNILDGFLTYLGVNRGYAVEVNPFMINAVSNILSLGILKLGLPVLLSLYLIIRTCSLNVHSKNYRNVLYSIYGANIFYLFILGLHIICIILYLSVEL